MMKPTKHVSLGVFVSIIAAAIALLGLQAWVLGVVLGWFGVSLAFWKCLVIVLLIGTLFGSSRSN
jgi:hypothetical protein